MVEPVTMVPKTLNITDAKGAADNISDLERWGDTNTWKLIAKASSTKEGWMKSTKAMEVDCVGVLVQVSTQQKNADATYSVAEAVTFVPFARIIDITNTDGKLIGRRVEVRAMEDYPNE